MQDNLIVIGETFPFKWIYGKYENEIIKSIKVQIRNKFPTQRNILINTTWFGPQFDNNVYATVVDMDKNRITFDNVFFLATVDPILINTDELRDVISMLGSPKTFLMGNFENSPYEFNFFSYAVTENFVEYNNDDITLKKLKYHYINYNRKPREHRVKFVNALINNDLMNYGIVTLGKPDITYDNDPNNSLFFSIGELSSNYVDSGDWFDECDVDDDVGIPHDLFSLHNMDAWKHHFLYINASTKFWPWDDVFVMQDQYRPIMGLRPFLINGNTRTYKWLRNNGFKTFTHYFPADLENSHEDLVQLNLIKALLWLTQQPKTDILKMYNHMMPELIHNKERMLDFGKEQRLKMEKLFK
jgi:hypothetical protein